MENYKKNSLSLNSSIAMGTGVMIGAGIFALTGQIAELSGNLFPLIFLISAIVVGFSTYSYVKMSNAYPSAGGIAMYLEKAYGRGITTAFFALLMVFSMVISESLVARTFGTYFMQLFGGVQNSFYVPILGAGLIILAFIINLSGNKLISRFSFILSISKVLGIAIFALLILWFSKSSQLISNILVTDSTTTPILSFIAAIGLGILAYKGFTTIANSGSEIVNPHKNISRSIIISLFICLIIYILVALAVASSLSIPEIILAKNYSLAEAAKPILGVLGLWFTIILAVIATFSGVIASIFAVSRMLAMMTNMKLIPHKHFGMSGSIQKHTLVYAVVIALILTIFFDLTRIASLGVIFYLLMDIAIHWGIIKYLHKKVGANKIIPAIAIILNLIVLGAFLIIKFQTDLFVVLVALFAMIVIFLTELYFFKKHKNDKIKGMESMESMNHMSDMKNHKM